MFSRSAHRVVLFTVSSQSSSALLFGLMTTRGAGSWAGTHVKNRMLLAESRDTRGSAHIVPLSLKLARSHNGERIHTERLVRPTRSSPKNYTSAPWELSQAYLLVSHFLQRVFLLFQSPLRAVSVFVFVWPLSAIEVNYINKASYSLRSLFIWSIYIKK